MAYPDFSEFTFGYAIVRYIEEQLRGRWATPNFPTQPQEADAGYDVDFLGNGVPLFIQFKRSEVMTRRTAKEFKDPIPWKLPLYRMHLHSRNLYRQHVLLRALERDGNAAIYCTSSVENKTALDRLYSQNKVDEAATVLWPSDIRLPNYHEPHHVSFNKGTSRFKVYSEIGAEMAPRTPTLKGLLAELRSRADEPTESTREQIESFVSTFTNMNLDELAFLERRRMAEEGPTESTRAAPYDAVSFDAYSDAFPPLFDRRSVLGRISQIESVVKRAALIAYFDMDAYLVSVSRKAILE